MVDLRTPIYATNDLVSDTRSLDGESVDISVEVDYQACNDSECLLPRTERFALKVPLDEIDVPRVPLTSGWGQHEPDYDGRPHVRRLLVRRFVRHPIGFIRLIVKTVRLNRDYQRRLKQSALDSAPTDS